MSVLFLFSWFSVCSSISWWYTSVCVNKAKSFCGLMLDRSKIVMSCQLSTKESISLISWRNLGICWLVLMLGIQLLLPSHFLTCSIWPTWQKKFKLRTEEGSSCWRRVILLMRTLPLLSQTLKRPSRSLWLNWRRHPRKSLMLWRTKLWIWF